MNPHAELLTNSRGKTFRSCSRRHHYEYVLGYRAVATSHALWFGDVMHRYGLEPYWLARRDGLPDPLGVALASIPVDIDPYDFARLQVMLTAYAIVWDPIPCEVLAVEQEFRIPLFNPVDGEPSRAWELGGKIDLILRLFEPRERIVVVEHKTSSEDAGEGSDYRRRLTLDTQIGQYLTAADVLGYPADGVIYDVLQKPSIRPLKATPVEQREYTQPKSRACTACKRKRDATPPPHRDEETGTDCVDGRVITDPGGRLYASMREFDETPEEYAERLVAAMAEAPDTAIQRIELHRFETERSAFLVDVWKLSQQIALVEQLQLHVPNADACLRYGGVCPFMPVCERTASLNDTALYRRLDNVHPELAPRAPAEAA